MPVYGDFTLGQREDGSLTIPMSPPQPIGGFTLEFTVLSHFGGISGLITKSCASGFYSSGITLVNSGQGILQISINAGDTSGWVPNAYPFVVQRLDSGFRTDLTTGYLLLGVNQGIN